MFTENFDSHVAAGDVIQCEVGGFTCYAKLHDDDCQDAPWQRGEGHGDVSKHTRRSKRAGELVVYEDGATHRFYDFAGACRRARAEGWGMAGGKLEGETARQYAARAARHDFEVLRAWCNDEWRYFGVEVTIYKGEVKLTGNYSHTLWGVEGNYPGSDNSYLAEVACELLDEALEDAKRILAGLCDCEGA